MLLYRKSYFPNEMTPQFMSTHSQVTEAYAFFLTVWMTLTRNSLSANVMRITKNFEN